MVGPPDARSGAAGAVRVEGATGAAGTSGIVRNAGAAGARQQQHHAPGRLPGSQGDPVSRRGPVTRSGREQPSLSQVGGVSGGIRRGPRKSSSLGSALDLIPDLHPGKQGASGKPAA